jgi:putative membrane protein
MMGYGNGWWMVFHGLVWLAFLIVVVVAAVALIRHLWRIGGSGAGGSGGSAVRILEERYARGEIDREEFLQRRRDLG